MEQQRKEQRKPQWLPPQIQKQGTLREIIQSNKGWGDDFKWGLGDPAPTSP